MVQILILLRGNLLFCYPVLEKYVYGKYLEKLPSLLKHIYALF